MFIPEDYPERCYAGWLGKIVGVRLGAPIEGWEYDKIRSIFGDEVYDYLVDYHDFAADDDTNGPIFFLKALEDFACSEALTSEDIGRTWLNYTPYEHGFYWWGGYGISTEHTAYLNLRAGIPAPQSGSIAQNGKTVAEQIGGQIFIDTWGLVNPGNPERAARFARKAAAVSHDGEGIYGGMFVAACIAQAFIEKDIRAVVEKGLSLLPADCEYLRMARAVMRFHDEHPDSWRDGFEYVRSHFGYDRYPGNCHIIPNSAVMVLAMLYGRGDFTRTIGICAMCGWDTDCTTGNVGTILGTLNGLEGMDGGKWLRPVHDFLACSSVMGSLNIQDIPSCALAIARLAYLLNGETFPERWRNILEGRAARFHFELPGSTHSFRVAGPDKTRLTNVPRPEGGRCLQCAAEMTGETADLFYRTYYDKDDFADSRYDPAFSPVLYPGQRVTGSVCLDPATDGTYTACLYAYDRNHSQTFQGTGVTLTPGVWTQLSLDIPAIEGGCMDRAGVRLIHGSGPRGWLVVRLDDLDFSGSPDYSLKFDLEKEDRWTFGHREISQMTRFKGYWYLEEGMLHGSGSDFAQAYTGDANWTDYAVSCTLQPIAGESCQLMARVQGASRSYAVRIVRDGQLQLIKQVDTHSVVLAQARWPWQYGEKYRLRLACRGAQLRVTDAAGAEILSCEDREGAYLHGAIGVGTEKGHCAFADLRVQSDRDQPFG